MRLPFLCCTKHTYSSHDVFVCRPILTSLKSGLLKVAGCGLSNNSIHLATWGFICKLDQTHSVRFIVLKWLHKLQNTVAAIDGVRQLKGLCMKKYLLYRYYSLKQLILFERVQFFSVRVSLFSKCSAGDTQSTKYLMLSFHHRWQRKSKVILQSRDDLRWLNMN